MSWANCLQQSRTCEAFIHLKEQVVLQTSTALTLLVATTEIATYSWKG